jgi:Lrp/AsnC family transcriptional regulator
MALDGIDLKILGELQKDATQPVAAVAERVGLTATPCWRRIQRLEAEGYIRGRVALLDPKSLNVGVTVFIAVRTNQHNERWLKQFHDVVASMPEVVDFFRMSGEIDYLIRAVLPDIEAYDGLYKRLIARVDIEDVSSMFAMERIKSTTELPLGYARVTR